MRVSVMRTAATLRLLKSVISMYISIELVLSVKLVIVRRLALTGTVEGNFVYRIAE